MILEAQPDIRVVAEASDGEAAIRLARRHSPDVVLMDVRMPGLDGLEATRRLLDGRSPSSSASPRVIVLTTFDLDEYVYAALQSGASGFLLKDVSPEQLVAAVRTVSVGDALLAPAITRRLVERYARPAQTPAGDAAALATLTAREREVFGLLARGMSNAEIADALVVGEATVEEPRGRDPGQARAPEPRAGGGPGVRVRAHPSRCSHWDRAAGMTGAARLKRCRDGRMVNSH